MATTEDLRTIEEINEKIKKGDAVVMTAAEMKELVRQKGLRVAAKEVDVVTTGTTDLGIHHEVLKLLGRFHPQRLKSVATPPSPNRKLLPHHIEVKAGLQFFFTAFFLPRSEDAAFHPPTAKLGFSGATVEYTSPEGRLAVIFSSTVCG